jgi:hypothetical protein
MVERLTAERLTSALVNGAGRAIAPIAKAAIRTEVSNLILFAKEYSRVGR